MNVVVRAIASAVAVGVLVAGCGSSPDPVPAPPRLQILTGDPSDPQRKPVVLRHTGDGGPIGDEEADSAFEYASEVLEHFSDLGQDWRGGATLRVFVRFQARDPRSATKPAWVSRLNAIVFGDGDVSLEAMATLAVYGLLSWDDVRRVLSLESRALIVALGDIFAAELDGDWIAGEGSNGPQRDLADPERLGDAAHTRDYDPADTVDALFHNATIVSHAYHLLTQEIGHAAAERIAWTAMTVFLPPGGEFEDFRAWCVQAAHGSDERRSVIRAFHEVGLDGTFAPRAGA